MRCPRPFLMAAILLAAPLHAGETLPDPDTVLFSRGEAEITVRDYQAALDRIPAEYRQQASRDPKVANRLLSQLLENRLLAGAARESGVADDPETRAAVRAAEEKVLARRQLEHVVEREAGDAAESMARDYYRAHPEEFRQGPRLDFRHVLVSTEDRGSSEARERAAEARSKLMDGADFDQVVAEFSDDEGSRDSGGLYEDVAADNLVKPFVRAAEALSPGEISEPVETRFGYHVIKLLDRREGKPRPFEAVRDELVQKMRKQQYERVRKTYLSQLLEDNPLEVNEQAVEALTGRPGPAQGGGSSD